MIKRTVCKAIIAGHAPSDHWYLQPISISGELHHLSHCSGDSIKIDETKRSEAVRSLGIKRSTGQLTGSASKQDPTKPVIICLNASYHILFGYIWVCSVGECRNTWPPSPNWGIDGIDSSKTSLCETLQSQGGSSWYSKVPTRKVNLLDALAETDSEDDGDVVCELPAMGRKRLEPSKKARHVILLVDASGSMRIQDVDLDAETSKEASITEELGSFDGQLSRLEAAELCCTKFAREHARARPHDVFSVVTFHESSTVVACKVSSVEMAAGVAFEDRAANGTFYLEGLTTAVSLLQNSELQGGELVLLSDGRPADTKQALTYFQEQFIRGPLAGTQLHGIGFGSRVESFAALQQLACLTGGTFALSGSTVRGLREAFSSVQSAKPQLRQVDFELPEAKWGVGIFGKKNVLRFKAVRSSFSFDGNAFHKQDFTVGQVVRRRLPYMRGGMRLVYGFQDEQVSKNGNWMVAKCSRYLNGALNAPVAVETHAKSTAIARYFASRFNSRLQALNAETSTASLFFVPCFVYEVVGPSPESEPRCFAAERYLPGVFLKYNSNSGYVADASLRHNDMVQAFLHFSFEESGGKFIVADLQGVARDKEVLLTDPQVLSLTREYGPGDLGSTGYLRCLRAHRCGRSCRQLGLTPISSSRMKRIESSVSASVNSWQQVDSVNSFGDWEKISQRAEKTVSEGPSLGVETSYVKEAKKQATAVVTSSVQ
eukprot:Skav212899  [mRNA]  locus=scaffold374:91817:95748:+ [translate_table: standard]